MISTNPPLLDPLFIKYKSLIIGYFISWISNFNILNIFISYRVLNCPLFSLFIFYFYIFFPHNTIGEFPGISSHLEDSTRYTPNSHKMNLNTYWIQEHVSIMNWTQVGMELPIPPNHLSYASQTFLIDLRVTIEAYWTWVDISTHFFLVFQSYWI